MTRKERRNLLGMSVACLFVSIAEIAPKEISALGMTFTPAEPDVIRLLLAGVNGYFLITFMVYGTADFLSWRLKHLFVLHKITVERAAALKNDIPYPESMKEYEEKVRQELLVRLPFDFESRAPLWSKAVSLSRAALEFFAPVVIGLYAYLRILR